jgi:uncharacterized OsmC-like protein
MSRVEVKLVDEGSCQVKHDTSSATLTTDAPPEYGGRGRSFSSTDLVSAALGSCIATTMQAVLVREGLPSEGVAISVCKTLSQHPKKIEKLDVDIRCSFELTPVLRRRLTAAVRACPVKRSLHPEVEVGLELRSG